MILALEDRGNLCLGVTYLSHVLRKENDFHMSPLLHSQNIPAQVGRMLPIGCIPLVSSHEFRKALDRRKEFDCLYSVYTHTHTQARSCVHIFSLSCSDLKWCCVH